MKSFDQEECHRTAGIGHVRLMSTRTTYFRCQGILSFPTFYPLRKSLLSPIGICHILYSICPLSQEALRPSPSSSLYTCKPNDICIQSKQVGWPAKDTYIIFYFYFHLRISNQKDNSKGNFFMLWWSWQIENYYKLNETTERQTRNRKGTTANVSWRCNVEVFVEVDKNK